MAVTFQQAAERLERKVQAVISRMKRLDGQSVGVGIAPGARYPDGKPVAEVADFIEHGTRFMPPRPFMRTAKARNYESWRGILRRGALKAVQTGESPLPSMIRAAQKMKADVQKSIVDYGAVRTGRLRDSVTGFVNGGAVT